MSARFSKLLLRNNRGALLAIALLLGAAPAWAGVPDWVRQAAKQTLPAYPPETDGVVLLDENITTVSDSGEVHTIYRRAVKVLRPNAELNFVGVHFDTETKLTYLKGWSISARGEEYEVKEKDAVETSGGGDELYTDTKYKVLPIPAGKDVGAIVAYEYQQKQRSSLIGDEWHPQSRIPIRVSRYTLRLPKGWEYQAYWINHEKVEPSATAPQEWTWQLQDMPAVETEDYMPPWRAIAARMQVQMLAPGGSTANATSWAKLGDWYLRLASDRRAGSPQIKAKVAELTAGNTTLLGKMQALATFMQKDIRYVAVEIGIGGYQPHAASEVFTNRFGDCKDKATLMSTMLREIGVDSYYVVINTNRGIVRPEAPSMHSFNHVILAIKLPDEVKGGAELLPIFTHPKLGRMLLYDPTSTMTRFGDLPDYDQANKALLVTENGGELISIPLLQPEANLLERNASLELRPNGMLVGSVVERRLGAYATTVRLRLMSSQLSDRSKVLETQLAAHLGAFTLTKAAVVSMEQVDLPLELRYSFQVEDYAKNTGGLLLVRPRVIGQKSWAVAEGKKRLYPVEFDHASFEKDTYEIALPQGYVVDELPDPVDVAYDFGEYHSKVEQSPGKLRYSRQYTIKQVNIGLDRLDDLKKFYRVIAADERSSAVLKKAQ